MEQVSFGEVMAITTPGPDRIVTYGDHALQFGELWLPPTKANTLILLIHGGCWLNQFDVRHNRPMGHALRVAGYAVWSIEYRRIGDLGGGWPGTFEDVLAAIDAVPKLELGTTTNLILMGHSAGGQLAVWAATQRRDTTSGAIGLAAITDLEKFAAGTSACERATIDLLGGTPTEQPDRYTSTSPIRLTLHPATHFLFGEQDMIVPLDQAAGFTDLAREHLSVIPGAGHFDFIHPNTTAFKQVIQRIEAIVHGTRKVKQ